MSLSKITHSLAAITVFLFFLYPMGDADLGWHLRYGEYFLDHRQLLKANTFSWSIPSYVWPNHSWGFDVIAALIFRSSGFAGLTVGGSLLITLSFWLITKTFKPSSLLIALLAWLYFGSQLLTIGLRSQLFSLVLTAYVFIRLRAYVAHRSRWLWDIPLIMALWANLHGQHIMGLAFLWLFIAGSLVDQKLKLTRSLRLHLMLVGVASIAAVFLNPFGSALFTTTLAHFNAPALKHIFEWMPWELNTFRMGAFLGYSFVLWLTTYRRRLKVSLGELAGLIACNLLAIKARRMIPFFILVSLPLFTAVMASTWKSDRRLQPRYALLLFLFIAIFTGFIVVPPRHITRQSWDSYCHTNVLCSEPLIAYLNDHPLQGKVFNAYRLGGHLIYRYPQIPVFIDGRMTVWSDTQGHSPFLDYLTIVHASPGFQPLLEAYDFDYVIIHPEFELSRYLSLQAGWPIIFDDGTVRVYQNPKLQSS